MVPAQRSRSWRCRLLFQVSVQRGSADVPLTCDVRFGDSQRCLLPHLSHLLLVTRPGTPLVHTALLGGSDPFGLALTDHLALELGEAAHEVHLELRERVCVG